MSADTTGTDRPIVGIGEFRLDVHLRCLSIGPDKVKLTPKPFSTLEFLVKNRHRVVSKAELLDAVWGGQREISTVEHAVGQLRRALRDDAAAPRYIQTVAGHGYRLVAEVREISAVAASPEANPKAASLTEGVDNSGETLHPATGPAVHHPVTQRLSATRKIYYVLGAVVLLGMVIGGVSFFKGSGSPERITIAGSTLTAWDGKGRMLWEHHFDEPMRNLSAAEQNWRFRLVDLNGDGRREVLIAPVFPEGRDSFRDELYCFAPNGKLLWKYKPDHALRFVSGNFSGPWTFLDMVVVPEGKRQAVWLSIGDRIWWPSILISFEANGDRKIRFVSSGLIRALHVEQNGAGTFVLAGGLNNEYRRASLAVLRADQAPATSPQTPGNRYQCLGCPAGVPFRYFLLPRSEVNVAGGRPYNEITVIYRYNGLVLLDSYEAVEACNVRALYETTTDFVPRNVTYSENYKECHQLLERAGAITHSWENCGEQKVPAIAELWDGAHGWKKILVPWVR
jgi:DNA-binding winged helix-turn-helix (wHTH) protein